MTVAELSIQVRSNDHSVFYIYIMFLTLCVAVFTGVLNGLLCLLTRDPENDHIYTKLVSNDYGLYNENAAVAGEGHQASEDYLKKN